jgi:hypothetical protein
MTVWVVMANDFPDKVFGTEAAAARYCETANAAEKAAQASGPRTRIYYQWYKFEVIA